MDFYKLLGIPKDATSKQIKVAYRNLAKKYHPDINKSDDEKFKMITQAYKTLIDPEKRKIYDKKLYQNSKIKSSLEKTLEKILLSKHIKKDIYKTLTLSLEEAYTGTNKNIRYKRVERCKNCEGTGITRNSKLSNCPRCKNRGYITYLNLKIPCLSCKAKGFVIQNPCHFCEGEGFFEDFIEKTVKVPSGIDEGEVLFLEQGGNITPSEVGNLYLKVKFYKHKTFKKKGLDLYKEIKLKKDNLPVDISFYDLNGNLLSVKIPKETQNKTIFRIKGRGFKNRKGVFGDLYIKVFLI
ncbi:MAG: DnaJ domain-containing protein [Aquificae bacterium]|nr:DnaJ domain-containing protein [Aquificota bacterium]